MATKYADRAVFSVNGAILIDLQTAELKQNRNAKAVPSMTPDGFNRGFVQGNTDIDIGATVAVRNKLARAKLEAIDYENSDVQVTFIAGAEQFIATGVFLKDVTDTAPGVGEEVKCVFNFGALRLTDAVGNSSLFNLSL